MSAKGQRGAWQKAEGIADDARAEEERQRGQGERCAMRDRKGDKAGLDERVNMEGGRVKGAMGAGALLRKRRGGILHTAAACTLTLTPLTAPTHTRLTPPPPPYRPDASFACACTSLARRCAFCPVSTATTGKHRAVPLATLARPPRRALSPPRTTRALRACVDDWLLRRGTCPECGIVVLEQDS